jgi:hypothetical protein
MGFGVPMSRRSLKPRPVLGARYQKALDTLEAAEKKMARAFNAWIKARAQLRALGKRIDTVQRDIDAQEADTQF